MTSLMREFLTWLSDRPRTYAETMEAWRTHCPRHMVWEDALSEGWIEVEARPPGEAAVSLTPRGRSALAGRRPAGAPDLPTDPARGSGRPA